MPLTRCTGISSCRCLMPAADERCFPPVHVYGAGTGHCVLIILRPGKTPDGREINGHIRRLVRRIRLHWPTARMMFRGDRHYGRKEVMDWCEQNDVTDILGLAPNKVLAGQVFAKLDECCVPRAFARAEKVPGFTSARYAAKSWSRARRVVARIEVTRKGADIRLAPLRGSSVTNIKRRSAKQLYEKVYCARGQAENLIKRHKSQLGNAHK
jgi:Transposase DDE domain group 1